MFWRGCAQAGGRGSKFRKLEEGEKSLTKVWSSQGSRYFIQIGHQVQATQLILYEVKNGNLEGLCSVFSWVNKGGTLESYMSCGEEWFLAVNLLWKTKRWGISLPVMFFRITRLK